MAERNYQVRYDIIADATNAIKTFNEMKAPLQTMKDNAYFINKQLGEVTKRINEIAALKAKFRDPVRIRVEIDMQQFKNALTTLEMNAKGTASRIRMAMESAFSGTRENHEKAISNLGYKNWQEFKTANEREVAALKGRLLKMRQVYNSFLSGGGSTIGKKKAAQEYIASKGGVEKVMQSAARVLNEAGIGNILNKRGINDWKVSDMGKFSDYLKGLEKNIEMLTKENESVSKANERHIASLKEQTRRVTGGEKTTSMGLMGMGSKEIFNIAQSVKTLSSAIEQMPKTEIPIGLKLTGIGAVESELKTFLSSLREIAAGGLELPLVGGPAKSAKKASTPISQRGKSMMQIPINPSIMQKKALGAKAMKLAIESFKPVEGGFKNIFDAYVKSDEWWDNDAAIDLEKDFKKLQDYLGKKILKPLPEDSDIYGENDMRRFTPESVMQLQKEVQNAMKHGKKTKWTYLPNELKKAAQKSSAGAAVAAAAIASPQQVIPRTFELNIGGNYKQHMKSLADFASSLPLLKNKNVKINIDVAGLSSESVNKIKNIQVPPEAKIAVPLSVSYKNARDMIPRTLGVLQKIVADRGGVKTPLTIDRTKVGGQLNSLLRNLRTLAAENKIVIPVKLQQTDLKTPKNMPTINVKAKVTGLTKAVREANTAFQNRAKAMKNAPAIRIPIQLKWGTGQENMQAQIKRMQTTIPALKVGVNLELAKAQIDELAAYIQKKGIINLGGMSGAKSQGQFRNYRPGSNEGVSYAGGGGGGRRFSGGNSGGMVYGGGGEGNFLTRLRRFAYPLTGNLSYGASSPMALQMFKDMPIMMGVGGAIGAITGGISNSFEYQDTMRVARSILERGYKGDNFERDYRNMEVTARNVARATKFTAPEAAEAVRFMAMAGLDIPRINSSIKPISDIALIGRNNLGEIADIMTNVQTTYKIPKDKMERMADAMANTFTKTNVDMMMIAESLKYAGGIAQLTGTSLGDSLAMIGIMGNNGIQGSMAGTSTRMMMQNMIRPNKNQAAMWAKIGVNTRDENGFVKDPIKLLGELRGYVDKKYGSDAYMKIGKGEEFKNKALGDLVSNMFRVTSTAGVAALLRDYDKLVQLSESNRSSDINGLADQLSKKQQNEVKGLIAKISSSFQEQILQIIEKNTGWIKQKLVEVNEWVSSPDTQKKLEKLIETLRNIVQGFIHVGEGALWAYEKFNKIKIFGEGLVDTLIKFQLYMSALGSAMRLVLSPLNIFSGFNFGRRGAAGAGAAMGGTGFAAFAGTGLAALFNTRRRTPFDRDHFFNNPDGMTIDEVVRARHGGKVRTGVRGAATLTALDALIARRQMQAYAASRIVGGNNPNMLDRALGVQHSREAEVARLQAIRSSVSSAALAQAFKQRRSEQLFDSVLIAQFIKRRGIQNSGGLIGQSLKANFAAGRAFGKFKGIGSIGAGGLITRLTSGVMGLVKALGMLVSPIGLATMAIGGLATAAYMLYRRNKENKNALQRDIDGMKKIRDLTNNNNGFNASALSDSSPLKIGIARVSANSGVISQGAVKNNPLLKNNLFFRRVLAPENNLDASVYQKYAGTLYDEFIANGFNRYSESPLAASAFQDASGTFKQGPEAYRFLQSKALQGAAMLQGGSSSRVNAWTNYIKKQSEKIYAIKDADKRNKAWEDLEKRVNEVSETYKKQAENLKSVTELQKKYGDNLKNARSSEIMNTSEYRLAEARAVGNLMKNMGNGAIGQYLATHVLDSGVKDKTGAAIRAIVNGMQIGITGNNGKELVSSLSFTKNGGIDWGKLQEALKKNGVDFELTVGNKMSIISSLLEQIKNNPYYKDVTNYLEKIYQEQRREQELKDMVAESYNRIIGMTPWGKGNEGTIVPDKGNDSNVPTPIKPAPKKSIVGDYWRLSSYSSTEGMGNNKYMRNASFGGGFSNKNNVVVNVGGISVYNDADMNEIEQRIEKGVVTAMSAVLVDQSNNSMYNI